MASTHPQRHLWQALMRRFGDQNKASTSPDRLLRGLCITPLDGQEDSSVWTLGFREMGATLRTVSLARDFQALSAMVDPAVPCYLVVYVGDIPERPAGASPQANWLLISYVPSTCSSFEARKMADNRAGLKAGLGAEYFLDNGLWCVSTDQITLSNYMRSLDAAAAGGDPGLPRSPAKSPGYGDTELARQQAEAAAKIQEMARKHPRRADAGDG